MRALLAVCFVVLLPALALASGHGPLFGGATPTLGRGGWQLDQTWMGRTGTESDAGNEQMLRTMVTFGITEDLQLSASMPIPLQSPTIFMPNGRMMSLMTTDRQFESTATWRFRRRVTASRGRRESALIGGFSLPYEKFTPDGMPSAPSVNLGAASGYASRAHYFWAAGGYQKHMTNQNSKLGDVAYGSVVYGYRPKRLRLDYPKPDLRFFVEVVAERTTMARHQGFELLYSGGRAVFVGPTALLLYKAYGVQGGMLFPVYQQTNGIPERFRFAVNVSYFFWLK
jgi:hypothetical protein